MGSHLEIQIPIENKVRLSRLLLFTVFKFYTQSCLWCIFYSIFNHVCSRLHSKKALGKYGRQFADNL